MATPLRPNVIQQGGATVYESLDELDEQLYNGITTLYQRAAFLDVIKKWRSDIAQGLAVPLVTGQDVQQLWQRRMSYWCKKRKNKAMVPRPHNIANPPLAPSPAIAPAAPPPAVAPVTPPPAVAPVTPPPAVTPVTPPAVSPRNPPSSGERSPVFRDDRHYTEPLLPTRGQRAHLFQNASGPWTFARVLASSTNGLWKANWLLVRLSATNTIEEQLVTKWVLPSPADPAEAQDEIDINEALAPVACAQVLPWRGYTTRTKRKRVFEQPVVVQTEFFMYSDFAPLGTLKGISTAHEGLTESGKTKHVPEHFIWYVLGELAQALLALKTGRCSTSTSDEPVVQTKPAEALADSPWAPILHNDIKDINVMIMEGKTKYPTYPRVLLFDFGLSKVQNTDGTHNRVEGTIIWSPPERMHPPNMPQGYVPRQWPVTEKSDVWGVGLLAWQLMRATHGVAAFGQSLADKHSQFRDNPDMFTNENLFPDDGLFPRELSDEEMPTEYSVELCRVVQNCLLYHPTRRPTVEALLQTSQQRLALLDRTHRGEFGNSRENILDEFRPEYGPDERNAPFSIGEQYEPATKRRRTNDAGAYREIYENHIDDWSDEDLYPLPTQQQMLEAMDGIRTFLNSQGRNDHGYEEVWVRYLDNNEPFPITLAWRHLYSTICKEIYPASEVYVSTDKDAFNHDYAFTKHFKNMCLGDMHDHFIPPFLDDDNWSEHWPAFRALDHAVQWGRMLLSLGGEPKEPQLEAPTAMHIAISDWVLIPEPGIDLSSLEDEEGNLIGYVAEE